MRPDADRFAVLFAGCEPALIESDESGYVLATNDVFCQLVGRSRDEILGAAPPLPGWSEDQRAWLAAQVGERFEFAAGRGRFSGSLLHRDGSRRDVVVSASTLPMETAGGGWS